GAVLHVIQDSYSNSHARRGICGKTEADFVPVSRVTCSLALQFFSYASQGARLHKMSDQKPEYDVGCGPSGAVHDPVTATANVLWLLARGESAEMLVGYLSRSVFPEPGKVDSISSANSGLCYGPKATHSDELSR